MNQQQKEFASEFQQKMKNASTNGYQDDVSKLGITVTAVADELIRQHPEMGYDRSELVRFFNCEG